MIHAYIRTYIYTYIHKTLLMMQSTTGNISQGVILHKHTYEILFLIFYLIIGFPSVIGVVDGTQIKILAPKRNEEVFVCRKGFHSINAQVRIVYFNYIMQLNERISQISFPIFGFPCS